MTTTLGATFWKVSRTVWASARGGPPSSPTSAARESSPSARVLFIGISGIAPASCPAGLRPLPCPRRVLVYDLDALARLLDDGHTSPGQSHAGPGRRGTGQPQVELPLEPGGAVLRLQLLRPAVGGLRPHQVI